jgi:hypothetical protein
VVALIASSMTTVIKNAVSLNQEDATNEPEEFFRWHPGRRLKQTAQLKKTR